MRENTSVIAISFHYPFYSLSRKPNPCTPHLHRRLRTSTAGLHVRWISSPLSAFHDPTRDRAFVAADPSLQDPGSNLTFTLLVNGFFSKDQTVPSSLTDFSLFCFFFFFPHQSRKPPIFLFFVCC